MSCRRASSQRSSSTTAGVKRPWSCHISSSQLAHLQWCFQRTYLVCISHLSCAVLSTEAAACQIYEDLKGTGFECTQRGQFGTYLVSTLQIWDLKCQWFLAKEIEIQLGYIFYLPKIFIAWWTSLGENKWYNWYYPILRILPDIHKKLVKFWTTFMQHIFIEICLIPPNIDTLHHYHLKLLHLNI